MIVKCQRSRSKLIESLQEGFELFVRRFEIVVDHNQIPRVTLFHILEFVDRSIQAFSDTFFGFGASTSQSIFQHF